MANEADQEKKYAHFNKIREEMTAQGYQEIDATISVLKANVGAFLYALPIIIIGLVLYITIWGGLSFSFTLGTLGLLLLAFFICVVVHELLHGLGWGLFCKRGFKSIRFGVMWSSLTPYCHCGEVLSFWPYLIGGLLPCFVLGILPLIVSLIIGNSAILMLSLLNILMAGGDLAIMVVLRKYKHALIIDHPTDCGFYAFVKD